MRKVGGMFLLLVLLVLAVTGTPTTHAQSMHEQAVDQAQSIYGVWFYQPPADQVKIVAYGHVDTYVTNEYFGLQYTDVATSRCSQLLQGQGQSLQYLVRYRTDPLNGQWVVYCYTDQFNYDVFSGSVYGQNYIDPAVARAFQIAYATTISGKTGKETE